MIQKIIYKLHEKWREFRQPIITIEGLKDKAVLLRLLINYLIKGSGTTRAHHARTHHAKHKRKKKSYQRGVEGWCKYREGVTRNGRIINFDRAILCLQGESFFSSRNWGGHTKNCTHTHTHTHSHTQTPPPPSSYK